MFWAIGFLLAGIAAGRLGVGILADLPLQKIMFWAILALLFIMGAQIGADRQIIANLPGLGLKALFLTVGALAGTILLAFAWSRLRKNRKP